ncbi:GGDEF domain-containing protein [Candidatus Woesearchaeota archaeon]|nr:GGDEF domain-containing protein [Candidatus Woesearchaeota archaeon]
MKKGYELAVALLGILDRQSAVSVALDWFVHSFNAANVTLYFNKDRWQVFDNLQYSGFESKIITVLSDSKTVQSGVTVAGLAGFYLAVPIIKNREFVGSLFVYSSQSLASFSEDILLSVSIFQKALDGLSVHEDVEKKAIHDGLTGLYNRDYFSFLIRDKLVGETSVALLDIDDFKSFNDTRGHLEGDRLLKCIADSLKSVNGVVCRYGGEEFAIFLQMEPKKANAEMELLRQRFESGERTVSIGLATKIEDNVSYQDMFQEADKALYKAKKQGKNRVIQHVIINKNLVIDSQQAAEMGR